ncbi:VRR-NUC domain-containing protein [Lactobacillus xujianguonis]|nr:VRR-NUC domain-containing protein [Lactobacillus xujianguonis]RVU73545.1 VRR-NUC domain-containing protein [Lactobacillus xujianguonis]
MLRMHRCECWRGNVGLLYTKDGRPMRTGLPNGFTDLFGMKISNGKAFYIEVKTPTGRIEHKQMEFHHELMHAHAIHGIARSVEDALKIVDEELVGYGYPKEDIWLV